MPGSFQGSWCPYTYIRINLEIPAFAGMTATGDNRIPHRHSWPDQESYNVLLMLVMNRFAIFIDSISVIQSGSEASVFDCNGLFSHQKSRIWMTLVDKPPSLAHSLPPGSMPGSFQGSWCPYTYIRINLEIPAFAGMTATGDNRIPHRHSWPDQESY